MINSTSVRQAQMQDPAVLRPALVARLPQTPKKNVAWWTLVVISVAADFLMLPTLAVFRGGPGPTLPQAVLAFGMLGSTLAQGSLLAVWLAWGDVPFIRRLVWHWTIAGSLCCIWLAGLFWAAPPANFHEVGFTVALTVPIVSLGAQFPLWAARLLFGWRLMGYDNPVGRGEPFSIRDLLLATLLVAASFAIARLSPAAQQEAEFRGAWFVFMTAAALFSVFAVLPTAPMLLRPRLFGRGARYGLAYAAVPILLLWLMIGIVRYFGLGNLPPWTICVGASCLILCYAGTAILAAAAARNHGYWLVWGRRPATCRSDFAIPPAAGAPRAGSSG